MRHLFIYNYSERPGGIEDIIRHLRDYLRHRGDQVSFLQQRRHESDAGRTPSIFVRFDSVTIFEPTAKRLVAGLAIKCLHPKTPLNLVFCGSVSEAVPALSRCLLRLTGWLFHSFLAISEYTRQRVEAQVKLGRIHVVYCPVDVSRYQTGKHSTRTIVSLGRLDPRKRHELLIGAFARVRQQHPAARLAIIGGLAEKHAAYRQRIDALIRELGLTDAVHLHLDATDEVKRRLLSEAAVYATASQHEMFGIATVEALASGLPVVAFDNSATSEVVAAGQGILVDSEASMAAAIGRLLSDQTERARIGRAATVAARRFDQTLVCRRYVELMLAGDPS